MSRMKNFFGALISIGLLLGLGISLIMILKTTTLPQLDNQSLQAAAPTSTSTKLPETEPIPAPLEAQPTLAATTETTPITPTPTPTPLIESGPGEIYFASTNNLYRQPVDEEGRASGPVERLPINFASESRISRIYPSPDGRQVVYFVDTPSGTCCSGVWTMNVLSLPIGQTRPVNTDGISAPKLFGWHLDNEHFKFAHMDGRIGLLNVNTDERIMIGNVQEWADLPYGPSVHGMAVSPDGEWVVASFTLTGRGGEIWLARTDGSETKKLYEDGIVSGMSWSPDGKYIAFVGYGVEVMDADGQNRRTVGDNFAGGGVYPAWSPDSRYLAFTATSKEGNYQVQVADVIEGTSIYLGQELDGGALGPAWSPDGSQITFLSNWLYDQVGATEIWVTNRDGTDLQQLITNQTNLSANPIWLPASRR